RGCRARPRSPSGSGSWTSPSTSSTCSSTVGWWTSPGSSRSTAARPGRRRWRSTSSSGARGSARSGRPGCALPSSSSWTGSGTPAHDRRRTYLRGGGEMTEPDIWDRRVAGALALVRQRLTGDYEVDEFGFDKQLTDAMFLPLLRPLYRAWFRVETTGIKHVPADGPALIVANHSGTVALDAMMLAVAVH